MVWGKTPRIIETMAINAKGNVIVSGGSDRFLASRMGLNGPKKICRAALNE
tara:strand:+ start:334 stop:486 length:153 start_codon:yes stop_codon:yes gene_type:complete